MPRYYCDYCDTYLTHDSPSVRKQHNAGYKHKANVRSYYQQFEEQMTQTMLDQRIKEHLGQAAQFPPIGAAYSQHLASFPRPGVPILPRPMMPGVNPLPAGMRPPVLPLPIPGNPGYPSAPNMASMVAPPGAPSLPNQVNGLPRPPTVGMPTGAPASTAPNTSIGAPSFAPPAMYQPNPAAPTSGGYDHFNANARAPESSH